MIKLLSSVVAIVVLVVVMRGDVAAEPITSMYSVSLLVDGPGITDLSPSEEVLVSSPLEFDGGWNARFAVNPTLDYTFYDSLAYNYGYPPVDGRLAVEASGYLNNNDLGMAFQLSADSEGTYVGNVKATFQWVTTESWRLTPIRAGAVLPGLRLKGNYLVQVTAEAPRVRYSWSDVNPGGEDSFSYSVFTGVGLETLTIDAPSWLAGPQSSLNVDTAFGAVWSTPGQSEGVITYEIRSFLDIPIPGADDIFHRIDGNNTFTLASVVFEDGSAPEDHGFRLEFSSGRPSPNVSDVPEVSTMHALLSSAVALPLVRSMRRRRRNR